MSILQIKVETFPRSSLTQTNLRPEFLNCFSPSALSSRPPVTSKLVILLGPARSGKTHELLGHYRATLEQSSPASFDRALWLAPNGRAAATVRDALVRGGLTAC